MSDLIEMGSEYEDGKEDKWRILCVDGYEIGYPVVAMKNASGELKSFTGFGESGINNPLESLKKVEPCKYVVIFEYCSRVLSIPAEVEVQKSWGKWIATVKYKVGQDDSES